MVRGAGCREPNPRLRRREKNVLDIPLYRPAIPVIPDPLDPNVNCNPNPENLSNKGKAKATSKPANENEVITTSSTTEPRR
jgi:hypothetical protein